MTGQTRDFRCAWERVFGVFLAPGGRAARLLIPRRRRIVPPLGLEGAIELGLRAARGRRPLELSLPR